MTLTEKVSNDLKEAMKNKEKVKLNVIRMLKSSIQMKKIEVGHDLTDEEVIELISKQIKMRNESIKEFEKGNRNDLKEEYQNEIDILSQYMPEQMTLEEVEEIVKKAFEKINPTGMKQMGLIMKEVTPQIKGRFDMGQVSQLIKEKLSQ